MRATFILNAKICAARPLDGPALMENNNIFTMTKKLESIRQNQVATPKLSVS